MFNKEQKRLIRRMDRISDLSNGILVVSPPSDVIRKNNHAEIIAAIQKLRQNNQKVR